MIALTTDSKSLLTRIRSAEALAALQPEPMANPTSAPANDSMSLIPSPVVATFLPDLLSPIVNKSLC
jgi:hypothetical protein